MCRNVGSTAIRNCVFGGKQNCLQKICGKEKYFRGVGAITALVAAASWRRERSALAEGLAMKRERFAWSCSCSPQAGLSAR